MKTLLFIASIVALAAYGYCAQPHNIGYSSTDNPLGLYSRTIAQINLLAADSAGQIVVCSDCIQSKICVSSGTAAGAWVVASATSTNALGGLIGHCQ